MRMIYQAVILLVVGIGLVALSALGSPPASHAESADFNAAGETTIKTVSYQPAESIKEGRDWKVEWADSKPSWFPYTNVPDDLGSYLSGGCWLVKADNLDAEKAQAKIEPFIVGANFKNSEAKMTKLESLEERTTIITHPAETRTTCTDKKLGNHSVVNECAVEETAKAWDESITGMQWVPYGSAVTTAGKANYGYETFDSSGTKYFHLCYDIPFARDRDYKLGVMLNGVEYHPLVNTSFNYQLNFSAYNSYDAELYGHTQNYVITATNLPADCLGQLYDSSDMSFLKYKVNATGAGECTLTINHTFAPTSSANWTFVYGNASEASFTDTATMGYKPAYSQLTEDFNGDSWNANYDWVTTYCKGGTNDVTLDAGRLRTANCVVIINSSSTTNGSAAGLPSNDDLPWDMHFGVEVVSTNDYGGFMFGNASQMTQGTITRLFKIGGESKLQLQKMSADAWTDAATYGVGTDFHFIINSTKFGAWKNSTVIYEDDSHGGNAWIGNLQLRSDVDAGGTKYTYLDYLYVGQPVTLVPSVGSEETGNLAPVINNYDASPDSPQNYTASLSINFDANVTDVSLNSTQFESNFTGSMINVTAQNVSSIYYYNATGRPAGNYSYRWIAEDGTLTSSTPWIYYNIERAVPLIVFSDHGNNTTPRSEMYPYTVALVAYSVSDNGVLMSVLHNGTNYTDADFDPSFTNITVAPTVGGYNFTAYYPGGQNHTVGQSEIIFEIYADTRNVSVVINGPANATIVANSAALNATIRGDFLSYECWYMFDGGTQQSLGNIVNNTEAAASLSLSQGGHNVNVTCINATVVMNGTQYFTATYHSEASSSYQATEFETNNTYFTTIINTTSNVTGINASLVWNGTAYPAAVTHQGNGYHIQGNATLPLITVNSSDVVLQMFYTLQGIAENHNTSSINTQEVIFAYELVSLSAPSVVSESQAFTASTTILNHLSGMAALVNNVTYRGAIGTGALTGAVYNASMTAPALTNITTVEAELTSYYYISFGGRTRISTASQNVSTVAVDMFNCAYGGNPILDFYGFDERSLTAVNYSLNIYMNAFTGTANKNFTANFTLNESHHICQNNVTSGWLINATMDYDNLPTYEGRSYFMIDAGAPFPARVNHYLLNTTYASQITFTVVDSGNNPQSGIIIYVQRWYPESNSYNMVAMGMSGNDGKAVIRLENIDAWYKILLIQNGGVLAEFGKEKLTGTTKTLQISPANAINYFKNSGSISTSCISNASNSVICTVVDSSGSALQGVELKLQRYGVTAWQELCDNTGNAVAGAIPASVTLVCNMDANITGHVYYYSLVMTDTEGYRNVLASEYVGNVTESVFGATGLLITAMLVVTLAAVGSYNPAVSLILGATGLILSFIMGFLAVSYGSILGMVVVLIIMALKVKT